MCAESLVVYGICRQPLSGMIHNDAHLSLTLFLPGNPPTPMTTLQHLAGNPASLQCADLCIQFDRREEMIVLSYRHVDPPALETQRSGDRHVPEHPHPVMQPV